MSAAVAAVAQVFAPRLTTFETEFIRTVLDHRGVFHRPSLADFAGALDVLRRYDGQCIANPVPDDGYAPSLSDESMAALRAKAYVMFETTRPTPAQWHKAQIALFGPLLCETCG